MISQRKTSLKVSWSYSSIALILLPKYTKFVTDIENQRVFIDVYDRPIKVSQDYYPKVIDGETFYTQH